MDAVTHVRFAGALLFVTEYESIGSLTIIILGLLICIGFSPSSFIKKLGEGGSGYACEDHLGSELWCYSHMFMIVVYTCLEQVSLDMFNWG